MHSFSCNSISQLWAVTSHMGTHCVIFHPSQVNTLILTSGLVNNSQYSAYSQKKREQFYADRPLHYIAYNFEWNNGRHFSHFTIIVRSMRKMQRKGYFEVVWFKTSKVLDVSCLARPICIITSQRWPCLLQVSEWIRPITVAALSLMLLLWPYAVYRVVIMRIIIGLLSSVLVSLMLWQPGLNLSYF